jgi:quercetin dioxygenase-like cupin family protein
MSEVILAERIKELLEALRQPALAPFLADWPAAYQTRPVTACQLPVLFWLTQMNGGRNPFAADVVATICQEAPSMAWRQTYSAKELDAAFLENYGWSEIIGGSGPLAGAQIACGILVLGPSTHYPRHRHEAEEVYLPLSGTAAWQQGGAEWRDRAPGTVIHHAGNEPHAMRTGTEPLLALYLWRGAGLSQKARLES